MQDLLPGRGADRPTLLVSNAPRLAAFPPKESTPLLEDLPGKVVMVSSESDAVVDSYYAHREFGDIVRYFYGADGRWRSLNLAELGIAETDFAGGDTGVGYVSPTGRYWTFRTLTRAAILDLKTGHLTLTDPGDSWRMRPEWGPDGMVMARRVGEGWILVDPKSGRTQPYPDRPRGDRSISFTPEGAPVDVLRAGKPSTKRLVEFANGSPVNPLRIPFRLPGRASAELTDERIALGNSSNHRWVTPAREMGTYQIVVTDRQANPEAVLPLGRRDSTSVSLLGWADADTLLLRVDQQVLAWRPDEQKLSKITRIAADTNVETARQAVLAE